MENHPKEDKQDQIRIKYLYYFVRNRRFQIIISTIILKPFKL